MKIWYMVAALLGLYMQMHAGVKTLNHWQYKRVGSDTWRTTQVPGTIHTSLLHDHLIPDPFKGDQEKNLQWIAEADWMYQTSFDLQPDGHKAQPLHLIFEGIDTYADVYLNERFLFHADNMFRTYVEDITTLVQPMHNTLRVVIRSARKISDSLAALSPLTRPCENNRHYLRKAQYHFGWDWAPTFLPCGLWRPVKLIRGDLKPAAPSKYSGIKLIQEQDSIGQSFYFSRQGQPLFMKGANWIPADVFLPRITHARYRSLLCAAKAAHINLLRVWGGGVYEDDYFYDLCDSLGIMVWQDFMFAGAMYPADSASLASIRQEAIDNILRLRRHPCIILWCGNNEIDEAWHNWGWQEQFHVHGTDSANLWTEYQNIFTKLLPSLIKQYDPGRDYVASSPLHGWGRKESMTAGDAHYWGVWWGRDSIQILKKKIPRFMSEYGMQAMPVPATIKQFASAADWDTSSVVMRAHQKHPTGFATLQSYLEQEHLHPHDFLSFIQATQELQSRTIATAVNAEMHAQGRCMGTMLWQFNDCWPVCSWSVIDYYGRPKKAYYTLQRCYAQQADLPAHASSKHKHRRKL